MAIRLSGMTLGGKLSIGYLLIASFLFVFGGHSSEWFLMILGFPLLYAPWVIEQVFGEYSRLPSAVRVSLFVLLWVGNAYLWGHGLAVLLRLFGLRSGGDDPTRQALPDQPPRPSSGL